MNSSIQQYALHLPLITILLKIPLLCPCIDSHLQNIRRGHDRKSPQKSDSTVVEIQPQMEKRRKKLDLNSEGKLLILNFFIINVILIFLCLNVV